MGKFPVISISLKEVAGGSFDTAKRVLRSIIGDEAARFLFLAESDRLSEIEQQRYRKLVELDDRGEYTMSEELLSKNLLYGDNETEEDKEKEYKIRAIGGIFLEIRLNLRLLFLDRLFY